MPTDSSQVWEEAQMVLFAGHSMPDRSQPQRPLGALSDFVVERLPPLLRAVAENRDLYDDMVVEIERLAADALQDRSRELLTGIDLDLASLDVNFLVSATYHGELDRPVDDKVTAPYTTKLATSLAHATGKIPIPSYEDLALINPLLDDPRVFSTGDQARLERDFYLAHAYIERCFDAAIADLSTLLAMLAPESSAFDEAASELREALNSTRYATFILNLMKQRLDKPDFLRFRPYFFTMVVDGKTYPGPSGRYTAGLPTIDAMFSDEHFVPQVAPELDRTNPENLRDHFPRAGRAVFDDKIAAAAAGHSVGRRLSEAGFPSDLAPLAKKLSAQLTGFRRLHHNTVKEKVDREDMNSRVVGTGGVADVDEYLGARTLYQHIRFPRV